MGGFVDSIKKKVATVWDSMKTTVSTIMESLKTGISEKWDAAKTAVSTTVDNIKFGVSEKARIKSLFCFVLFRCFVSDLFKKLEVDYYAPKE